MRYLIPLFLLLIGCVEPVPSVENTTDLPDVPDSRADTTLPDAANNDVSNATTVDFGPDAMAGDMGLDMSLDGGMDMTLDSCVPEMQRDSCLAARAECGQVPNNCGEMVECGMCGGTATCNNNNVCECPGAIEAYRGDRCVTLTKPEYVTSVTPVSLSVGVGASAQDFVSTSTFAAANSVPFFTMRAFETLDFRDDVQFDIWLPADGQVVAKRLGTEGEVALSGTVVEFDPTLVRVQSGTFYLDTVSNSSAVTIDQVELSRAFVVFYFATTNSSVDDKRYDDVAGYFENATTLNFAREAPSGAIEGHWFVVEALSDQFEVTHRSLPELAGSTASLQTGPFSPEHSFVVFSHSTDSFEDDIDRTHMTCSAASGVSVICQREEAADRITNLRVQLVSLRGDGQRVHRGQMSIDDGVAEVTAALDPPVARPTAWGGYAGKIGACWTNITSSSGTAGSFVELDVIDSGATVRARRGTPNSTAATGDPGPLELRHVWEVISW